MATAQWEVERVTTPGSSIPPDTTYDILAGVIDEQALSFPEPARYRNSVYAVLKEAETLNIDALALTLAWQRLERIFLALEHFKDPEITLDALRCLGHLNTEHGVFMADLARKHGISRVSMYKRVQRLAKFLGVPYRKTKVKGSRSPANSDQGANRALRATVGPS